MEMGFTGASMEIGYGPRVGRGIDGRSRHRFDNGHIGLAIRRMGFGVRGFPVLLPSV